MKIDKEYSCSKDGLSFLAYDICEEILNTMEKEKIPVGAVELLPEKLSRAIKENKERLEKAEPFRIQKLR